MLLVAVVAFQNAFRLVHYMEYGRHRLVVGDALGIVATHNTAQLVGGAYSLLLHHFIVVDDVQHHIDLIL